MSLKLLTVKKCYRYAWPYWIECFSMHLHEKKQHKYMIWLQASQCHYGPLFFLLAVSLQTSFQKIPFSPYTPPSNPVSYSLIFFSTSPFCLFLTLSPRMCLSSLAAAAGCSLEPESVIPVSPSPPTSAGKDKRPGLLVGTLPPSSLCCRVHLQRREWPIELEPAGS